MFELIVLVYRRAITLGRGQSSMLSNQFPENLRLWQNQRNSWESLVQVRTDGA